MGSFVLHVVVGNHGKKHEMFGVGSKRERNQKHNGLLLYVLCPVCAIYVRITMYSIFSTDCIMLIQKFKACRMATISISSGKIRTFVF